MESTTENVRFYVVVNVGNNVKFYILFNVGIVIWAQSPAFFFLVSRNCFRLNVVFSIGRRACVVCQNQGHQVHLTLNCRVNVFVTKNIFLPSGCRSCPALLNEDGFIRPESLSQPQYLGDFIFRTGKIEPTSSFMSKIQTNLPHHTFWPGSNIKIYSVKESNGSPIRNNCGF
ncbi:unnamed protein product [Bemisia tabaci]|uniref:Uncharacterized protein n=1 Tax=Bemisia tabaci TaxID=7038 RepID=A0A9P0ANH8_BEMTA|nr:unnamed protein product [Bemisia tabaci]